MAGGSHGDRARCPDRAIHITRANGTITIDGDLSDEGWRTATRIEKWYEVNPGDNVEPKVKNVGYLTYDDRFFYAAFEFEDPNPKEMRAPVRGSRQHRQRLQRLRRHHPRRRQHRPDCDVLRRHAAEHPVRRDHRRCVGRGFVARLLLGIGHEDHRTNGGRSKSGCRSRRSATGHADPQTWGILLYRNYPARFGTTSSSPRTLPRGGNCFICRANTLVGLERLPSRRAPRRRAVRERERGRRSPTRRPRHAARCATRSSRTSALDVKFTPNADNAVDLTVKPDFSQVESDTAQISANERFALFFPEKRPFFLEGVDLLSDADPGGLHADDHGAARGAGALTGKAGGIRYTALVADDDGGGSVDSAGTERIDRSRRRISASTVFVGRAKREHRPVVRRRASITDRESARRQRRTTGWSVPTSSGGRRAATR